MLWLIHKSTVLYSQYVITILTYFSELYFEYIMFYVDTISIDVEMCAVVLPKLRTKMKTKTIF